MLRRPGLPSRTGWAVPGGSNGGWLCRDVRSRITPADKSQPIGMAAGNARPVGLRRGGPVDGLDWRQSYGSHKIHAYLRRHGIPRTIPERANQSADLHRCGPRGGRPIGFDRTTYRTPP